MVDEVVIGDARDPDVVGRAVEGVDVVVHAAALHEVRLETWPAHDF